MDVSNTVILRIVENSLLDGGNRSALRIVLVNFRTVGEIAHNFYSNYYAS